MKKIAWLSDFKTFGGGEETQNILLEKCPKDLKVDQIIGGELDKDDYDLYIIGSVRRLTDLQIKYFISKKNYIVCWRDIIDTPHDNLLRDFYLKARTNIFLSTLHRQEFFKKFSLGEFNFRAEGNNNFNINTPYFDVSKYEKSDLNRKYDTCWVGDIQHHKGIETVLLWAQNNNKVVDFYGRGHPVIIKQLQASKYANYLGYIKDIHHIYPQYKYFIHLPDKIEAFGRSCVEAFLCGCKMIIHQDKIGGYGSHPYIGISSDDTIKKCLTVGPSEFWRIVKNCI